MKYKVTLFKSLSVALKELEPYVRHGLHLQNGKPFASLGEMRSREALANWLLCVAINAVDQRELTFTSDPVGGDGVIWDSKSGETWQTEHVMVPRLRSGEGAEDLILEAVRGKCDKGGAAYANGKTLVVFLDAEAGEWNPNRVARELPEPLHFAAVWAVGRQGVDDSGYVYNVTCLDVSEAGAPVFRVRLANGFDSWTVKRIQ